MGAGLNDAAGEFLAKAAAGVGVGGAAIASLGAGIEPALLGGAD